MTFIKNLKVIKMWHDLKKRSMIRREKGDNRKLKTGEDAGKLKKRVLIIDDESDIAYLTKKILEGKGYLTFTANSGAEGIKIAEKEKPDLILLDLKLPDIDGFELLNELKENEETKDIPVAIFSVVTEKEILEANINAKYDFYIEKPFKKDEFLSMVTAITNAL